MRKMSWPINKVMGATTWREWQAAFDELDKMYSEKKAELHAKWKNAPANEKDPIQMEIVLVNRASDKEFSDLRTHFQKLADEREDYTCW